MKFVLIVIAAFHFDAGPTSLKQEFGTQQECNAAKAEILQAFKDSQKDGWGRSRIVASCVAAGKAMP